MTDKDPSWRVLSDRNKAYVENFGRDALKEKKLSVDLPIWLISRYKELKGYLKDNVRIAMMEYLDKRDATVIIREFLAEEGKDILESVISDLNPREQIEDFSELLQQTLEYIRTEARGMEATAELALERAKRRVLIAIHHEMQIPEDALAKVGLEEMIRAGIVEPQSGDRYSIVFPGLS